MKMPPRQRAEKKTTASRPDPIIRETEEEGSAHKIDIA